MNNVCKALTYSKSQIYQDVFALFQSNFKRGGYFVEFGAADGITLSNTYLLEKYYGWNGILAEPAKIYCHDLKLNRDAHIDYNCVLDVSNRNVQFCENGMTSHVYSSTNTNIITKLFNKKDKYYVNSVSLNDLLERYNAPYNIDYLSIDTEGTELDIMKSFQFSKYKISVITIEHNFSQERYEQQALLMSNGYKKVMEKVSFWDDWYIL